MHPQGVAHAYLQPVQLGYVHQCFGGPGQSVYGHGQGQGHAADPHAHTDEHSLEVNVPFIQYLFSQARILPIAVPPTDRAVEIGQEMALRHDMMSALDEPQVVLNERAPLRSRHARIGAASVVWKRVNKINL